MKRMKLVRGAVAAIGAACALGAAAPVRAAIVDGVAVVVNGDVITLSEVEERVGRGLPPAGENADLDRRRRTLLKQAAEQLVSERLLAKEAEEQGLAPTEAEIENAIDEVKRSNNIDADTLEKALEAQGLTAARYREMLATQLTRMKVVELKVKSRVSVSDDDVRARYAKMTGDLKAQEELRLRDIIVPKGDDAAAAKAKAEAARARVLAGEAFAKVAEASGGPLAGAGGDFGWVKAGTMLPELEARAFQLKTGVPSEVLEVGDNFHVLFVEDRRTVSTARPLSEARQEIQQQIVSERLEKATEEYLAELKRSADVEYRLP